MCGMRTLFASSFYQPRRPRASPLWQIDTATWDAFLVGYWFLNAPDLEGIPNNNRVQGFSN